MGTKDAAANMRMKAIDWYMRGYSKKQSMIKAGYSPNTASTSAISVFGRDDVVEEIDRRRKQAADKAQVDANWIVGQLKNIASANLGDLLEIDDKGGAKFDMSRMTPELKAALGEFTSEIYMEGRGDTSIPVKKMKIKLADKLRALEMLGKYLGIFQDRVKVEVESDLINRLYAGRARVGEEEADG